MKSQTRRALNFRYHGAAVGDESTAVCLIERDGMEVSPVVLEQEVLEWPMPPWLTHISRLRDELKRAHETIDGLRNEIQILARERDNLLVLVARGGVDTSKLNQE